LSTLFAGGGSFGTQETEQQAGGFLHGTSALFVGFNITKPDRYPDPIDISDLNHDNFEFLGIPYMTLQHKSRRVPSELVQVPEVTNKQITQKKVSMPKIRVLLIEDNRILREGITATINGQGDITVAGVSDGRDNTLAKARAVKPHVVLIDLGLDSQDSLDIVQAVKKEYPGIKIIGMGLAPAQADILEFVQAGAEGFILKNASVEDVIKTIRAVAGGETVLPYSMAGSLFTQVTEHALSRGKRSLQGDIRMTQREKEVIALIVDGMSNKQIAESLHIATFTVKSHVHNILEKLALHSRLQIAKHAQDEKSS
jgi:DNA-binding NarL/FixJ family response regulator